MALKKLQQKKVDLKDKRVLLQHEKAKGQEEEWEDVDEHEREVFATTGYFDVPEVEALICESDQKLL